MSGINNQRGSLSWSSFGAWSFVLLFCTSVAIALVMSSLLTRFRNPGDVSVGDVATRSISAPRDFLIEDISGTRIKKEEVASSIRPILVWEDSEADKTAAKLGAFFQSLTDFSDKTQADARVLTLSKESRADIERQYRLNFEGNEWEVLGNSALWPAVIETIKSIADPMLARGIVSNRNSIDEVIAKDGATLFLKSNNQEQVIYKAELFAEYAQANKAVERQINKVASDKKAAYRSVLKKLSTLVVRPNVSYDKAETERRVEAAKKNVETIYNRIKRGEIIVRSGEVITAAQHEKLLSIREATGAQTQISVIISNILIAMLVISICYFFTEIAWGFQPRLRDLTVISLTLVGSFTIVQLYSIIAESLSLYAPDISPTIFVVAAPLAAGGILLQTILGIPGVFLFTVSFALLISVFLGSAAQLSILIVLANFFGAISVKSAQRRSAFLSAGIRVAILNFFIVSCLLFLDGSLGVADSAARLLFAILGGLTSGVLSLALAPVAEYFGSYITDAKLLELSSLDNPLLRELSVQAPGTWNHSMVMGQMAEAAAEAINADALLARVGAYYHDIGKTRKSEYFVENQSGKENKHDKLTPSMSALIIMSHVKDGLEMAKQHRLPPALVDFIPQHHGTALIEFFYDKAKREAEEGEVVDDSPYRYPGPKPQTKEAGILMLADGVEASARTLSDPSPTKIQGLVQKIINKVFVSGQLDECELTLGDLHHIAKSFTRVLSGIHHRRVQYSEPAEKRNKPTEHAANEKTQENAAPAKQQKPAEPAHKDNKKNDSKANLETNGEKSDAKSREQLKRLGM